MSATFKHSDELSGQYYSAPPSSPDPASDDGSFAESSKTTGDSLATTPPRPPEVCLSKQSFSHDEQRDLVVVLRKSLLDSDGSVGHRVLSSSASCTSPLSRSGGDDELAATAAVEEHLRQETLSLARSSAVHSALVELLTAKVPPPSPPSAAVASASSQEESLPPVSSGSGSEESGKLKKGVGYSTQQDGNAASSYGESGDAEGGDDSDEGEEDGGGGLGQERDERETNGVGTASKSVLSKEGQLLKVIWDASNEPNFSVRDVVDSSLHSFLLQTLRAASLQEFEKRRKFYTLVLRLAGFLLIPEHEGVEFDGLRREVVKWDNDAKKIVAITKAPTELQMLLSDVRESADRTAAKRLLAGGVVADAASAASAEGTFAKDTAAPSPPPSSSASSSEEDYVKLMKDKQVLSCPQSFADHHYAQEAARQSGVPRAKNWIRRVAREFCDMQNSLPLSSDGSIFLRWSAETDQSLMKVLIAPNTDTPYGGGVFLFDVYIPPNYPNEPPKVNLMTTGGGTHRFNPNLYHCGKVCLSLLGTWEGEKWNKDVSTLYQVFVSIFGLIFTSEPYFNEPGYERNYGTAAGKQYSDNYNESQRSKTVSVAMLEPLQEALGTPIARRMYPDFLEVIVGHFKFNGGKIIDSVEKWAAGPGTSAEIAKRKELLEHLKTEIAKVSPHDEVQALESSQEKEEQPVSKLPTTDGSEEAEKVGKQEQFVPAATYAGAKAGFVFKKGDAGVGYYEDLYSDWGTAKKAGNLPEPFVPPASSSALKKADAGPGKAKTTKTTTCRFFMQGRCYKGESCNFWHSESYSSQEAGLFAQVPPDFCRHFLKGTCNRGVSCKFSHGAPSAGGAYH